MPNGIREKRPFLDVAYDARAFRFQIDILLLPLVRGLRHNQETASLRSWAYGIICDMHPLYEKANAASADVYVLS